MNKNQIERELLKQYKSNVINREIARDFEIAKLRKADSKFKDVEAKLKAVTIKAAENPKYNAEFLSLTEKYNEFLKKAAISDIEFDCDECKDTGYVENERCNCLNEKIVAALKENSGVSELSLKRFKQSDFSKFDKESADEVKKIYKYFEKQINNFDDSRILNYVVSGPSGCGKTFLFSAIAGELVNKGIDIFYLTAFNLNSLFLKYHTTFSAERENFLTPVLECKALLIDDLGTEQILKNVSLEYFLTVLKERIIAGKKTFINTNLSPAKINEIYGERIFSRLFDKSNSFKINFTNKNMRIN